MSIIVLNLKIEDNVRTTQAPPRLNIPIILITARSTFHVTVSSDDLLIIFPGQALNFDVLNVDVSPRQRSIALRQ